MTDLTICTVCFHSRQYLEQNIQLAERLNLSPMKWLIVDNTPNSEPGGCLLQETKTVEMIEGFEFQSAARRSASLQHARALNKGIQQVQTRFVLVLDPDFYIVRQNWVQDVLNYMDTNNLAFLGVPWHPKWFTKYRYFPCIHCLFIDLTQINRQELDFLPEVAPISETTVRSIRSKISPYIPDFLRKLVLARQAVGQSNDTGFLLYHKFYNHSSLNAECITPVFKPQLDIDAYQSWPGRWIAMVEPFLPERFSYVPKKEGYFTQAGFKEAGYLDARVRNWEEFFWQGLPFGFHVRGFMQQNRDRHAENRAICELIDNLTTQFE